MKETFTLTHTFTFTKTTTITFTTTYTNWGIGEKYGEKGFTANWMSGKSGLGVPES
jgi:hypothetical protein